MIRAIRLAVVLAAAFFVCGGASADTIKFGAILPLTGPGGLIGTQQMRGIQFAIDQANAKGGVRGNKIEVQFEDNQAKPDQSVLSFNKLVDLEHLPVIFTAYSGPTLAMAPLATRKKVLMINAGAQADKLATASPYLINTLPTIGDEIKVMSKYLASEGKNKAAILFENDAAGISGRDDYLEYFPKAGGTIVAQEPTQFGQTDFRPGVAETGRCEAAGDAGFDHRRAVTDGAAIPAARPELHRRRDHVLPGSRRDRRSGIERLRAYPGSHRRAARTGRRVQAEIRRPMEFFVRQYYNATQILLTTLDKVLADGKPVTGENMRDTLLQIRKFQGLIPLEFKSNTATVPIDINMMQDGKDVTIKQLTAD